MKFFLLLISILALSFVQIYAYSGGSGTSGDPWQIADTDDLIELSNTPADWEDYFVQTANIVFDSDETNVDWDGDGSATWDTEDQLGFSPIGNSSTNFTGEYDGGGFYVANLYIDRPSESYVGLFGFVDGAYIVNFGVSGINITGDGYVGAIVGLCRTGTTATAFKDCYSSGSVVGVSNVGGFVAVNSLNSIIESCYSVCDVTGGSNVGGFAGRNYANATLQNCYSIGDVTRSAGYFTTTLGGFCGYNENSYIDYCYSNGDVYYDGAADPTDKGFVGGETGAMVRYTDNFFDSGASNQSSDGVGGATAKSTIWMKSVRTFVSGGAEWDFAGETNHGTDDVWDLDPTGSTNSGYPYHTWTACTTDWLEAPASGDGSSGDPYQIANLRNLYWLSQFSEYWDDYFVQTADIDASSTSGWNMNYGFTPIGGASDFTGEYDGNGYGIQGLFIDRSNTAYVGLFGRVNGATIKNLGLNDADIKGYSFVGGFTATAFGGAEITGCFSTSADVTGEDNAGIFIGYCGGSTIGECYCSGTVSGDTYVGGFAGKNYDGGTIESCFTTGNASGTSRVGGFVGGNEGSNIENCYSRGDATRSSGVNSYIGGFCGYNYNSSIEYSYATGDVFYTGYADPSDKGFVGLESGTNTFTDNFFDSEASNQSTDGAGTATPRSTMQMTDPGTFISSGAEWDFIGESTHGTDDFWDLDPTGATNGGYPYFADQVATPWLEAPASGTGLSGDPYQIATLKHLFWLSQFSEYWDDYFIQTAHIDAASTSSWESGKGFSPIGNSGDPFTGEYDGDGYVVQNLYVDRPTTNLIGLFGYVYDATIENLGVSGADITGDIAVGSLAGYVNNSAVRKCYGMGDVVGSDGIGCLIGQISGAAAITACYSSGDAFGETLVGGLIGQIVGSTISNCFSFANVTRTAGTNGYFGGLCGFVSSGTIEYSYCLGDVDCGTATDKGFVGAETGTNTYTDNFFDNDISDQNSDAVGAATPKSTSEMKTLSTFIDADWDFAGESANGSADYWDIDPTGTYFYSYPYLSWLDGSEVWLQAPSAGSGTSVSPYQIANLKNLFWLSQYSSQWDKDFVQTADIDASTTSTWHDGDGFSPIGNAAAGFTGEYDGGGFEIQNLYINCSATDYIGFFGVATGATIENIGLPNAGVSGDGYVGCIVGYSQSGTTISNCFSSGSVTAAGWRAGGIAGINNASTIRYCGSSANVNGLNVLGGLIGENRTSSQIIDCYSLGSVSRSGGTLVAMGGFCGFNDNGSIEYCYCTGDVDCGALTSLGFLGIESGTTTYTSNFFDSEASNQSTDAAGAATPQTTAQMTSYNTFYNAGWDFVVETDNGTDDIWGICSSYNGGYPFLSWGDYPPYVTTNAVSNIGTVSADCGGNATCMGIDEIQSRGVCWNLSGNPTIADSKTTNGSGTGSFSSSITGLSPETRYYARAYADNGTDVGYGALRSFWTLSYSPASHATLFRAEKNATDDGILFTFSPGSQIANCDRYLIIGRECVEPTDLPVDGTGYDAGDVFANSFVAGVVKSSSATQFELTSLITIGKSYFFKLIPLGWDGANEETINYYTGGTIPMEAGAASTELNLYFDNQDWIVGSTYSENCYKAEFALLGTSNIYSGASVEITSKTNVLIHPGFRAYSGSSFLAAVSAGDLCPSSRKADPEIESEEVFSGDLSMKIYPNPTDGFFILELSERPEDPITIEISNLVGQNLTYSALIGKAFQFDISDYPQGTYFVTIRSGAEVLVGKVYLSK